MSFKNPYREFIYKRTYARFLDKEGRREDWSETINRYKEFFLEKVPSTHVSAYEAAINEIVDFNVMPSMRALWTAGEALKRENIAGYNCAYVTIDRIKAFPEILYILMNGCGAGFSVERQYVQKLPDVPESLNKKKCEKPIVFEDSKLGWAQGFYDYLNELYSGCSPEYDLSKVRPKGSPLKTFGGRASGPEPLKDLLEFTKNVFKNAVGRKLTSIECHDICCKIASIVVVGGVRRSACISLSNRSDDRMAHAKDGASWFDAHPQRGLANNSIAYTEKPEISMFLEDWMILMRSNSGERGIFNRESANFIVQQIGRRKTDYDWGCNPCCLPSDTKILTVNGEFTIRELLDMHKAGENVPQILTFDVNSGTIEKEDLSWIGATRSNATLIEIEMEDGTTLQLTPDHKVYTKNRGYVEAGLLQEEDELISIT